MYCHSLVYTWPLRWMTRGAVRVDEYTVHFLFLGVLTHFVEINISPTTYLSIMPSLFLTSLATFLHLMLVYAMLSSDAIMSSVVSRWCILMNSSVGSLCIQESSHVSNIFFYFCLLLQYPYRPLSYKLSRRCCIWKWHPENDEYTPFYPDNWLCLLSSAVAVCHPSLW